MNKGLNAFLLPLYKLLRKKYATKASLSGKQDTLVSGTNLKTINNNSLLGSGNLSISDGTQLYMHRIYMYDTYYDVPYTFLILSTNNNEPSQNYRYDIISSDSLLIMGIGSENGGYLEPDGELIYGIEVEYDEQDDSYLLILRKDSNTQYETPVGSSSHTFNPL